MPSWLLGTLVIIVLLAIALFREGRRVRSLKGWCRAHGFVEHDKMPEDLNLIIRGATEILRPGPARIYGAIIDGHLEGRRYVFADFEASSSAARTGEWHALVMTPVAAGTAAPTIGETSLPQGLPKDARSIRHEGWDLIRWSGAMTVDQLEALRTRLPRLLSGPPDPQGPQQSASAP